MKKDKIQVSSALCVREDLKERKMNGEERVEVGVGGT